MPKTIKLSQETYDRLEAIREKRETFDQAVWRMILILEQLDNISKTLGPAHYLKSDKPPAGGG